MRQRTLLVTTKTILDHQVEIHVDSEGKFLVRERDGHGVIAQGDSMKQALRAARMEYRKQQIRVAVPFTYLDGPNLYPALARGFHASDRYRLLIWINDGTDEGKNDQVQMYSYGRATHFLVPDIPEKDLTRIRKLFEREKKLEELTVQCKQWIREWQDSHTFDLRAATEQALEEAARTQADDADEDQPSPVSTDEDKEVDELLGGN
jgi:hypothetical protein